VTRFTNYFELKLPDTSRSNEILRLISERVTIVRFERLEPSLYDIFLDLAGGASRIKGEAGSA